MTEVYQNFVNKLKTIYKDDAEWINNRTNLTSKQVKKNLNKFVSLLDDDEMFDMFINKKLKLFSSKNEKTNSISESLFTEDLTLKNILNKQPEQVKNIIWTDLHNIYLETVKHSEMNDVVKERVNKLEILYKDKPLTTEDMVNDILASFNSFSDGKSGNPFEKIMEISTKIQDKYGEKIESGEINLDNLMSELTGNLGGLENILGNFAKKEEPKEKVIIDENFSTEKVQKGKLDEENNGMNMGKMVGMINKVSKMLETAQSGEMDMSNLTDLLKELSPNGKTDPKLENYLNVLNKLNNVENEEEAEKLKVEMENMIKENQTPEMAEFLKSLGEEKEENKQPE
jgi:hypothetical protein